MNFRTYDAIFSRLDGFASLCPVAIVASLSEPKVMQRVLCKDSLLFPEGFFALDESYGIAESFMLIIVYVVFTRIFSSSVKLNMEPQA